MSAQLTGRTVPVSVPVPAVPVPLSVSGKTVPTVPVSGSGSVPEPPWLHDLMVFEFDM